MNELFFLAYTDQLTQCYNRNMLEEFRKDISDEDTTSLFVTIVDIDGLKWINDSEGHLAGDACIKWVASRLIPRAGIVFRLGGDEFLLLDHEPIVLDNIRNISYGSVEKQVKETLAQAMHRADTLMYNQKRYKNNRMEKGPLYVNRIKDERISDTPE